MTNLEKMQQVLERLAKEWNEGNPNESFGNMVNGWEENTGIYLTCCQPKPHTICFGLRPDDWERIEHMDSWLIPSAEE